MTFTSGNTVGAKLTDEVHTTFVNVVRMTGRLSIAAGRCAIALSTARHWMQRGRSEEEGVYHDFVDAVEKAKAEFLLLASKQLNRLALGGRVEMPCWDKAGNPIRDHREDCAAVPGVPCGCPLVLCEKVLLPESRILMWQMDRCDPAPNGDPAPEAFGAPALSEEAVMSRALANYALTKQALQIFVDLGADISTLPQTQWVAELEAEMLAPAIETSSTAAPAEPEPAKESVVSADANPPTEPSDKPPEAF